MRLKLYIWWVKMQYTYMPWTKFYKYRQQEWDRMRRQSKLLKSLWFGGGHKGMLNIKEQEKIYKHDNT
jgi:coproporphyrinogen III oxidase-like Fe-S oxidoreductase